MCRSNCLYILCLILMVGVVGCTSSKKIIYLTPSQIQEEQRAYLEEDLRRAEVDVVHAGEDTLISLPTDEIFVAGSENFNEKNFRVLNATAAYIRLFNIETIKVAGYTDNSASSAQCKSISTKQAEAVADYLVREGIHTPIIYAVGYGNQSPIASNDTLEGAQKNRRVQISFRRLEATN